MDNKNHRFFYLMQALAAGVSTRAELAWMVCQNFDLAYPSGSVTRLISRIKDMGLVVTEHVRLFRSGSFELIRLSQQGRQWCLVNGVGGQPGRDGEWDCLRKHHAGDICPRHTAGLLLFAHQARKRNYEIELLPSMGCADWQPDACVDDGHPVFVEFETRARLEKAQAGKWAKAQRYANLNGGSLGIVAIYPYAREKLAEWAPDALVTDLQSLCRDQQRGLWYTGQDDQAMCL
ncbi:MAG TPA: hypothetical protein PKL11_06360 [Anaerolineaceae bacterium]|nr:hypothetical protein [Anaerolineaceae bacterium]